MVKRIFIILFLLCGIAYAEPGRQTKPPIGTQINWAHPLSKGLVGCWIFNESSGDKVYDLSLNNNTGTLTSMAFPPTPTSGWNPGRAGPALSFDGSDDYVVMPTGKLKITGEISIFVTFKPDSAASLENITLLSWDSGSTLPYAIIIDNAGTTNLRVYLDSFLINYTYSWKSEWYSVVTIFDNLDTAYIYLNGALVKTQTGIGPGISYSVFGNQRLQFGFDALDYFNGLIDNVRIYNRALQPSEIVQLYADPYCIFQKPINLSWLVSEEAPAPTGQVIMITGD